MTNESFRFVGIVFIIIGIVSALYFWNSFDDQALSELEEDKEIYTEDILVQQEYLMAKEEKDSAIATGFTTLLVCVSIGIFFIALYMILEYLRRIAEQLEGKDKQIEQTEKAAE